MMKVVPLSCCLLAAATVCGVDFAVFRDVPRENRPETWFHIIGGNASKEGLTEDLEAISSAGIRGIHFFHGAGGLWPGVTNPIPCLSSQWEDLIGHLGCECRRLDLTLKLQNCPGWSMSGGPWIAPSNAMRRLVAACRTVDGGTSVGRLPPDGGTDDWRDYRDVAVLAFPAPAGEGVAVPRLVSVTTNGCERMFVYAEPVTFRTLSLPSASALNHAHCYELDLTVTVTADGRTVRRFVYPQGAWQEPDDFTAALTPHTARTWTVRFECPHPLNLRFVRFGTAPRLDNWQARAARALRGTVGGSAPVTAADAVIDPDRILDLSHRLRPDDTVDWTAPAGRWTVLRIGHSNLGARNAPAPREATGWECDKLDPRGFDANFAGYVGRLLKGPLAGVPVKGMMVDSWECNCPTWTERMPAYFRAENGFDIRPHLPALFGWIIGSSERTEAFLRTWRATTGALITRNYYGRMAELAHAHGLEVQFETAFGDVLPGDLLAFWKHADVPMCEFWHPFDDAGAFVGSYNFKPVRPCVSAAHVYGKRRVAAEAFTNFALSWDEDFHTFKSIADRHFARGVTHIVFHTYTHNPIPGRGLTPGSSFGGGIGAPFLRNQTFWRHMPAFTAYFARAGALLESGRPVVDVLRLLGDALEHKPSEKEAFPSGYARDYMNTDALLTRVDVTDGRYVFPDGFSARVLWIPQGTFLLPATEARLAELAKRGGRIVRGDAASLERALAACGIRPDVETPGFTGALDDFMWYHRGDGERDVYFVASAAAKGFSGPVVFRARGRAEIWDAVSGTRHPAPVVARGADTTTMRLSVPKGGSAFVVFDRTMDENVPCSTAAVQPHAVPVAGPWTVSFEGIDAPAPVRMDRLTPWCAWFTNECERAFSGTATYRTAFDWKGPVGGCVRLDLGTVCHWAEVRVNGRAAGTVWCPPWSCDLGGLLQAGTNELEIVVTSSWHNRLVYEARHPEIRNRLWTLCGPKAAAKARPSGLIGPVSLRTGR